MRSKADGGRLRFIEFQQPTLDETPPDGDGCLHEIKYDGYRTELLIEGGKASAFTRRGFDWSDKYGPLVDAAAKLPVRSAVIDGEVIVMNDAGLSDFSTLRSAVRWRPSAWCSSASTCSISTEGSALAVADRASRRAGEADRRRLRRHSIQPSHRRQRPCLLRSDRQDGDRGHGLEARQRAVPQRPHRKLAEDQCYEETDYEVAAVLREPGRTSPTW
jgi:bifunctional non-homologous end joining protein LigD